MKLAFVGTGLLAATVALGGCYKETGHGGNAPTVPQASSAPPPASPPPTPSTAGNTPASSEKAEAAGDADAANSEIEKHYTADYRRCMASGDAANGVTSALIDCARLENDRQDRILNDTYKTIMATLPDARKDQLRQDERAWLKQRKAKCDAEAAEDAGGSLAEVDYNDCMLKSTTERVIDLKSRT